MAMSLIRAENLTLRYGQKTVLDACSAAVHGGERIGLIGLNGCGKTSLLQILAGTLEPDSGKVIRPGGLSTCFLRQEEEIHETGTVIDAVMTGMPQVNKLAEHLALLEGQISDDPDNRELLSAYGRLQEQARDQEAWNGQYKARAVLGGLGFSTGQMDAPLETLSGGWRVRAALARVLLGQSDILLLDEPTNHLDPQARDWFAQHLNALPSAIVVVSHDRDFLDAVVHRVFYLSGGKLTHYRGNWSACARALELDRQTMGKTRRKQEAKVAQLKRFIDRNRARKDRAGQARSKERMIERIKIVKVVEEPVLPPFLMPKPPRLADVVISCSELTYGFDGKKLFSDLNLVIRRGERLAVIGSNGTGKTTLLRLLSGDLSPIDGKVRIARYADVFFARQDRDRNLRAAATAMEEMRRAGPEVPLQYIHAILGRMRFATNDRTRSVKNLSGGEKARLVIGMIIASAPGVLLLDEPTNHLDIPSRQALEHALAAWEGTIVLASHDTRLVRNTATAVLHLDGTGVRLYEDGYEEYLRSRNKNSIEEPEKKRKSQGADRQRKKKTSDPVKANRYRIEKMEKRAEALMETIDSKQAQLDELYNAMANGSVFSRKQQATEAAGRAKDLQTVILDLEADLDRVDREIQELKTR